MVILFDGVCNLCNGFVQFVLKRDKKQAFKFASLQSDYGMALCQHFKPEINNSDTILLYRNKQVLLKSDAVLSILLELGGLWKCLLIAKLIPRFLRNILYDFIAKHRYTLFGKRANCMVPDKDMAGRFIDNMPFNY